MHYYQFNIGDYKSHTEHLSDMEDLAYRRLLDWYYLHESPIPLDVSETARQIRMRSHCDCIATVLNEFFERTDAGWAHRRADRELAKAGEKSAKAAESARKRWANDANAMRTHSEGSAKAMRPECEGNATQDTRHITQDTRHKTQDTIKKRATSVACPPDVNEKIWSDWVALRKAKKAVVSETVITGVRKEAGKIGWTLEEFLTEWCIRGSQGLKAEWLTQKVEGKILNRQEALEARNREVVARMLAKENHA